MRDAQSDKGEGGIAAAMEDGECGEERERERGGMRKWKGDCPRVITANHPSRAVCS
jgi:hypothetical protein